MISFSEKRICGGYCRIIPIRFRFCPGDPIERFGIQFGRGFHGSNVSTNSAGSLIIAGCIVQCLEFVDFIVILLPPEFLLPSFFFRFPLCFFPLLSLYPYIFGLKVKSKQDLTNTLFDPCGAAVSNKALSISRNPQLPGGYVIIFPEFRLIGIAIFLLFLLIFLDLL